MSQVFTYSEAGKDTGQIHDALIRAGLTPQVVLHDGTTITLTYPDGQAQGPVDAIVAAHVPQARYVPAERLAKVRALRQRERLRGDYERAKTQASGATTLAQLRDAVLTVLEARRA